MREKVKPLLEFGTTPSLRRNVTWLALLPASSDGCQQRERHEFRADVAKRIGLGFELPKAFQSQNHSVPKLYVRTGSIRLPQCYRRNLEPWQQTRKFEQAERRSQDFRRRCGLLCRAGDLSSLITRHSSLTFQSTVPRLNVSANRHESITCEILIGG